MPAALFGFNAPYKEHNMPQYAIIEVEDGLTIVEIPQDQTVESVAASAGGVLIDSGPYSSFQEASDALANLQLEGEEDRA
jgi:hypothetical protein